MILSKMAFKDIRKQQFARHQRINSSAPSKWLGRVLGIVLVMLVLVAGGYDFPGAWNASIGRIPGLSFHARNYTLGLDLLGGAHLVYEADLSQIANDEKREALEGVRDVIERRVNAFGVSEPVVQTTKSSGDHYRIIVELAGVRDVSDAIRQIGETPILEFKKPSFSVTSDDERTPEEINAEKKALAEDLLDRVRKQGASFEELVAEFSEGPQKSQNGVSAWVDESDERAEALPGRGKKVGAVSADVLEKENSFSVVKFSDEREVNEWQFSDLTVCFTGANGCDESTRAVDEARVEAERLASEATTANFAELANAHTDDAAQAGTGGDRGWNRMTYLDTNVAVALTTHNVGEIFSVKTASGYRVVYKRAERPYTQYKFQEIELMKAGAVVATPDGFASTGLGGAQLKRAGVEFDPNTGVPYVTLQFDKEGADLFAQITEAHVGQQIAIYLDEQIISAPVVQSAIYGGEAIITGQSDLEEARLLAQRLNAGALPVPIELVSQQTVGPTLGAVSLDKSLQAAIIGIVIVALFMMVYYRLPGVLSVVALGCYAVLVLAIFKFLPVTLTLSGLAGFVLSVGMAVDANVLIFERLKEELRAGRSLDRAIDEGFKRAWSSIRDGNLTTLIACAILYWLSSSFIQGFALTLAVGVLVSMFSAITVTRILLKGVAKWKWLQKGWLYCVKELRA